MARRVALLLVMGVAFVSVPAATGAPRASVVAPVARLLCGCDLGSTVRTTSAVVQSRVSRISMSIIHTFRGCHVWMLGSKTLGPVARISAKPGTRLTIRVSCPMDFDLEQVAGPKLRFGGKRLYAGSTRTIVFRRAGVYKLVGRNVQTSEEVGLQTLGADNVLRLIVRVR